MRGSSFEELMSAHLLDDPRPFEETDPEGRLPPGLRRVLLKALASSGADMIQGDRSHNRRDTMVKRFSSWVGRSFRRMLLGDTIRDTGCSLRVFRREVGLALPLQYKGMHRFIPFYARELGFEVIELPVSHRPRVEGSSKIGLVGPLVPACESWFVRA